MSRWICTADELPDYGVPVLIYNENGDTTVGWRTYTDMQGDHWNDIRHRGCVVTHWMEKPEAPTS